MNTDGSYKNVWIATIDQLTNVQCYEYVVADSDLVFNLFKSDEPIGFRVVNINVPNSDVIITFKDYPSFVDTWKELMVCPIPTINDFYIFIRAL